MRSPSALFTLAASASPGTWTHGHRLLLVPIGNAAGLVAVLVLATFSRLRWGSRLGGVAIAAAAGLAASFTLPAMGEWFFGSAAVSFLAGFLPPAAMGGGFLLWRRTMERPARRGGGSTGRAGV